MVNIVNLEMVRVSLDLGTRKTTSFLEARFGLLLASQGGHRANPLVANTGPQPVISVTNDIDLKPGQPLPGHLLQLLRTASEVTEDLQLRVDEVTIFVCSDSAELGADDGKSLCAICSCSNTFLMIIN